jgi:hypothetical protein
VTSGIRANVGRRAVCPQNSRPEGKSLITVFDGEDCLRAA